MRTRSSASSPAGTSTPPGSPRSWPEEFRLDFRPARADNRRWSQLPAAEVPPMLALTRRISRIASGAAAVFLLSAATPLHRQPSPEGLGKRLARPNPTAADPDQ